MSAMQDEDESSSSSAEDALMDSYSPRIRTKAKTVLSRWDAKKRMTARTKDPRSLDCCRRKCSTETLQSDVIECREEILRLGKKDQRQMVMSAIKLTEERARGRRVLEVKGRFICRYLWMFLYGISMNVWYSCKKQLEDLERSEESYPSVTSSTESGEVIPLQRRNSNVSVIPDATFSHKRVRDRVYEGDVATAMFTWITAFVTMHEFMPHKDVIRINERSKKDVWRMWRESSSNPYRDIDAETKRKHGTFHTFLEVWRNRFPHVHVSTRLEFAVCGTCFRLDDAIRSSTGETRDAYIAQKNAHRDIFKGERDSYACRKQEAALDSSVISLVINGADAKLYELPHERQRTKDTATAMRIPLHLVGAHFHGMTQRICNFIVTDRFAHDSNLTVEIIVRALAFDQGWRDRGGRTQEEAARDEASGRAEKPSLPRARRLYLQLDNCWRENKNRTVIAFLGHLVHCGAFDEIQLSFLPVGHTHCDIDQDFSTYARRLRHVSYSSIAELCRHIRAANKATVMCEVIDAVARVRELLEAYPSIRDLHEHTLPHAFRFFRDERGRAALMTKTWSKDPDWLGTNGNPQSPYILFDETEMPDLRHCEQSRTKTMKPELVEEIRRGLDRMRPYLSVPSDLEYLQGLLHQHTVVEVRDFHWHGTRLWNVLSPLPDRVPPPREDVPVIFERDRQGFVRGRVREEDAARHSGTRSRPRPRQTPSVPSSPCASPLSVSHM